MLCALFACVDMRFVFDRRRAVDIRRRMETNKKDAFSAGACIYMH